MSDKPQIDWLADVILSVLQQQGQLPPSWVADKRTQLLGLSRLKVLYWVVNNLDSANLAIVADHLGVSVQDLMAVRRVLSKI